MQHILQEIYMDTINMLLKNQEGEITSGFSSFFEMGRNLGKNLKAVVMAERSLAVLT